MAKKVLKIFDNQLFVVKEGKTPEKKDNFIDLTKISVIEIQPYGFGDGNVKIIGYDGDFLQTIILTLELKTFSISDLAYDYFNKFASENLIQFGFVKLDTNTPIWVKSNHQAVEAQKTMTDRPILIFYNSGIMSSVFAYNILIICGVLFTVLGLFISVLGLFLSGVSFFLFGVGIANKVESVKKQWNTNRDTLKIHRFIEKK